MRKILAVALVLGALLGAWAEELGLIVCDCGRVPCHCFLQEGDEGPAVNGVIALLKAENYLAAKHAKSVFDGEVTQAICAFQLDCGLPSTGMLDDLTLTMLLWGEADTPDGRALVWVPVNGGKKYHSDPECSGMIEPRKIRIINAQALGVEYCKRCFSKAAPALFCLPNS